MPLSWSFFCLVQKKKKSWRHEWEKKQEKNEIEILQAGNILLMVMISLPLRRLCNNVVLHFLFCFGWRIRSNKKMLLLVGGLPPGPDRLPSNLVQYYDDEKKTWKILTSECPSLFTSLPASFTSELSWELETPANHIRRVIDLLPFPRLFVSHWGFGVKD